MACKITETLTGYPYYTTVPVRFTDKSNNSTEREQLFKMWWTDQINQYGVQVDYYVKKMLPLSGSTDKFYGENAVDGFYPPVSLILAVQLTENATSLTRYGLASDDEIQAYIAIDTFATSFSSLNYHTTNEWEPNAGDVFQLVEYGDSRPSGRNGKYFEVTHRTASDIAVINQLGGHYVFKLTARRFENSFEENILPENKSTQVIDDTHMGDTSAASPSYTNDIDTQYDAYIDIGNKDDVYGNY